MKREVRIGSRRSALALAQSRIVMDAIRRRYPDIKLTLVTMDTLGDIEQSRPIEEGDGKALFTDTLEQALREGRIDICVHSLKDMPVDGPDDLYTAAFSKRADARDALILPQGQALGDLGSVQGGTVGCSSARRRVQLLAMAPSLAAADIRGNVPTRLKKLDDGQYGALVLAMAGLERLGLGHRSSRVFSVDEMVPAAGQGILAVQARRGESVGFLDAVGDPEAERAAQAELGVMRALHGGCSVPAAAYAEIRGEEMRIWGMLAEYGRMFKDTVTGEKERGLWLADALAKRLKKGVSGVDK